jgi:hypothetical protein
MVRRVFFSFHFANDYWRTQQVRNIGALEGKAFALPTNGKRSSERATPLSRNGSTTIYSASPASSCSWVPKPLRVAGLPARS